MDRTRTSSAAELAFAEGFQAAQSIIASMLGVDPSLFERFVQIVARQPGHQSVPLSAIAALRGLNTHPGLRFGASEQEIASIDQVVAMLLERATEGEAAAGLDSTRH